VKISALILTITNDLVAEASATSDPQVAGRNNALARTLREQTETLGDLDARDLVTYWQVSAGGGWAVGRPIGKIEGRRATSLDLVERSMRLGVLPDAAPLALVQIAEALHARAWELAWAVASETSKQLADCGFADLGREVGRQFGTLQTLHAEAAGVAAWYETNQ
jgi:hypothetical protein